MRGGQSCVRLLESRRRLQINVISRYGKQERYFFIQIGRCADYGQGELWMQVEDGSTAAYMHGHIDAINQRESERRKTEGIRLTL